MTDDDKLLNAVIALLTAIILLFAVLYALEACKTKRLEERLRAVAIVAVQPEVVEIARGDNVDND